MFKPVKCVPNQYLDIKSSLRILSLIAIVTMATFTYTRIHWRIQCRYKISHILLMEQRFIYFY